MLMKTARTRNRRGFSLLEVLLTVGVFSTFFLFLIQLGQAISKDQAERAAAVYVSSVDRAVRVLLATPDRFNAVYDAVVPLGTPAQITIENIRAGSGLAGVTPSPVLDNAFPDLAPFRQTYRILLRVADNPAISTDTRALEVFVASETMLSDEEVRNISALIQGGGGGSLRDEPDPSTGNVVGAFGNWTVPMTALAGTPWHAAVTGSATAPAVENGGYVVSYHYYNLDKIARDYLYRSNVGNAELNAMGSDLSLGGYNLLGADDIEASESLVGEQMIVQGNARFAGAMTINGPLQADGPSTAGNISAASPSSAQWAAPSSRMEVSGTTTTNNAVFRTSVDSGSMRLGQLTTQRSTIQGGTLNATATSGIFAGTQPTGIAVTGSATVNGQLKTTNVNSQDIVQSGGNMETLYLQTDGTTGSGDAVLAGGVTGENPGDRVQQLNVSGTARVDSFGACEAGC